MNTSPANAWNRRGNSATKCSSANGAKSHTEALKAYFGGATNPVIARLQESSAGFRP
jgi:hypothetical protein